MLIYIVYGCYEYEWQIDIVFSSKKSAENYIEEQVQSGTRFKEDYSIDEYEVYD